MAASSIACARAGTPPRAREPYADAACGTRPTSRVIAENERVRRVRRPPLTGSAGPGAFVIKVDCESVGSTDLFLAYEDLPPGGRIRPHHHPHMDEILVIQRGSGIAMLDGQETSVAAGATIYIAPNSGVGLRNTGNQPLGLLFIFSHTGYGTYLRKWSVAEGETVKPLSEAENAARLADAHWLQVFEP